MNNSLLDLVNLISLPENTPKRVEKVDKNLLKMLYSDKTPTLHAISCSICKKNSTWQEGAKNNWRYRIKQSNYICNSCY